MFTKLEDGLAGHRVGIGDPSIRTVPFRLALIRVDSLHVSRTRVFRFKSLVYQNRLSRCCERIASTGALRRQLFTRLGSTAVTCEPSVRPERVFEKPDIELLLDLAEFLLNFARSYVS
jgi:hypothetical protein